MKKRGRKNAFLFLRVLLTFLRKADILQLRYCEKCITDNEIWGAEIRVPLCVD